MAKSIKKLEVALSELHMAKGLAVSLDKAVFRGLENNSIEWLIQSHLDQGRRVINKDLTNGVKRLEDGIRETLCALRNLEILITSEMEGED